VIVMKSNWGLLLIWSSWRGRKEKKKNLYALTLKSLGMPN